MTTSIFCENNPDRVLPSLPAPAWLCRGSFDLCTMSNIEARAGGRAEQTTW